MAISKIVSSKQDNTQRKKVLDGAIAILFSISGILALLLAFGSKGLAILQGNVNIFSCYIILAPSLIFSAGIAVLKGYYQGVNKFNVSALSGIIEQVIKVLFGLILIFVLSKYYILGALFGAMIGVVLGDIVCFVYLLLRSRKQLNLKYSLKNINNGKQVFKYAYPIMLYSLIVPLSNFIDSFLVVKLLGLHLGKDSAILLYGLQTGVVGAIISIPSIFSFALASVLMPSLSGDYATKNMEQFNKKTSLAFKLVMFVVLPCAIFFAINSSYIIDIVYGSGINGFGVDGQYVAKILLTISSISVVFSSINQLSAVILQNLNKTHLPIINLALGMICKLAIELTFVPSARLGIYAYSIAVAIGFIVAGVLNLYEVERSCENFFDIKYLIKQFILSAVVFVVLIIIKLFNNTTIFILGSMFTIVIYFVGIYLIKLFSKNEINLLINKK